jgi:hypothetical protein
MSFDPVNFRAESDKPVTRRKTQEPECIKDLPKENVEGKKLTIKQLKVAKEELVNKEYTKLEFPKNLRFFTDPQLNGQYLSLISFIPSKGAIPDSDGCFGVLKIRGTFDNEERADAWADNIIRNFDSYATIDYSYVGKFFPLMINNEIYRTSTKEIDIRKKVDTIAREDIKKKRDEEKMEMMDVQRRHKELLQDVSEDKVDKYEDLDFYLQLRVKRANLILRKEEMKKSIEDSKELVEKVEKEIKTLDKAHPEYKDEYMERYNQALASSGIKSEDNPLYKYLKI